MAPEELAINQLRDQESALVRQIEGLEETVESSSTAGIREFRMTRLRQLQSQRVELSRQLRQLETSDKSALDVYLLGNALKEATLVAEETFRT